MQVMLNAIDSRFHTTQSNKLVNSLTYLIIPTLENTHYAPSDHTLSASQRHTPEQILAESKSLLPEAAQDTHGFHPS